MCDWNGRQLDGQHIALHVVTATGAGQLIPLVAAAASTNAAVLVFPQQWSAFLERHSNCNFAADEAAAVHLAFDAEVPSDSTAREVLWNLPREQRWICCHSLAALLLNAGHSKLAGRITFPELCQSFLQREAESLEDLDAEVRAHGQRSPQASLPPELIDRLCQGVRNVFDLCGAMYATAEQTAEWHQVPANTRRRYGPLGLGPVVQGTIAARQLSRRGLPLDPDSIPTAINNLAQQRDQFAQSLSRDKDARKCFRWASGQMQFEQGLPAIDRPELQAWLESLAGRCFGANGVALPRPRQLRGDNLASSASEDWNYFRRFLPKLDAWRQLLATSRNLVDLQDNWNSSGRIRPQYQAFHRWESSQPSQGRLQQLVGRELFRAAPDNALLVGTYPDLWITCFAIQLAMSGDSVMLQRIRAGDSVVSFAQQQLAAHLKQFRTVPSHQHGDLIRAALEAHALQLGPELARRLANHTFNIECRVDEMSALYERLAEIFPELQRHATRSLDVLARNLAIERQQLVGQRTLATWRWFTAR